MRSAFAINMVKARRYLNWSQEKAAGKIGTNRSNLGAYEEGRATPKMEVLLDICQAYGIPDLKDFISNENFEMETRRKNVMISTSRIEYAYDKAPENVKKAINSLLDL